ncbi:rho guanine nucleotide exchange factor 3-like isoform X2 [Hydractinia symbiolongicarpus]|nr:rho guanine nucleotide exchange factor 3-like isoform X2 [Hydractinia symbiolongicarpus]XP_057314806.1 rho guanine nucleotide exchange factor 3-like isoform X2 [Hydractinia symbiolongicarpus]
MEKKLLKRLVPRRSPRLLQRTKYGGGSTSMQDLRLKGADDLANIVAKSRHEPKIKTSCSDSNFQQRNVKQKRALKRMRDSTLSLRSIENVMPTPLKRIKSCSTEKISTETIRFNDHKFVEPAKRKFTSKMVQFAKGLSPRKSFKKKSMEDVSVQRSSSVRLSKHSSSPANSLSRSSSKKYKQQLQQPTPTRRRGSKLWVESVASIDSEDSEWTPQQIKRQEAIYELYCGETDLVEDLKLLHEVYFNPASKLKLLSEEDLASIFGSIQALLPLHEDLVKRLEEARSENGSIEHVGKILTDWIPTLRPYIPYCANQLQTKDILFQKVKDNKQFSDFLQRCLESPFSRKLDLWSFLDSPRGRLVKYPLLMSSIHKYTAKDHPDRPILYRTTKQLETLIKEADREAGISKCAFYKERLYIMDEGEYKQALDDAEILICHGCLRNKSGSKLEAFLFDTIFVCTRLATRSGTKVYHVFSQPILVSDMAVADVSDGEVRLGGSFRTTLSKGPGAKHAFRVFTRDWARGKSIILQAHDQHDKKQWLNSFHSVIEQQSRSSDSNEQVDQTSPPADVKDLPHFNVAVVDVA